MKIQQLGRLTELPKVPEGRQASMLILEYKSERSVLYSYIDQDEDIWYSEHARIVVDNERIMEEFPNGFDAVLITFEPEDNAN